MFQDVYSQSTEQAPLQTLHLLLIPVAFNGQLMRPRVLSYIKIITARVCTLVASMLGSLRQRLSVNFSQMNRSNQ